MALSAKKSFIFAQCSFFIFLFFFLATPCHAQLSTDDHLAEPGFWPTQGSLPRDQFVGSQACAACHPKIAASQKTTPMGRTAMLASDSEILRSHSKLNFSIASYRYEIKTSHSQNSYSISDGTHNLDATLLWAFGTGRVGQSYLFKKNGDDTFYEARVTYFSSLQNLHFTPARALESPKNIDEAMYRQVSASEITRCFGCHTTASTTSGKFDEKNLMPGVGCEACHGPGANHAAAMKARQLAGMEDSASTDIFNPSQLNPVDSVDFCGACHGTWWDTKLSGAKGPTNARSQPYRLENSKCWRKGDARLTCIACHDPHQQLQTDPASYDSACLRCHLSSKLAKSDAAHAGAACPIATKRCTSCHMPKVLVPEMHYNFTDHRIRIVRPQEVYPE